MSELPSDVPIAASDAAQRRLGAPGEPGTPPPRRGRKRLIPTWLVAALFFASAIGVFWAFYLDVARLGPTHFGLVVRGDQLISVYEPGQTAHKVPILDHLLLLDRTSRPLSSVRMSAPTADKRTAHIEIVVVFRYFDPRLVWEKWRADEQKIREGLDADLRQLARANMAVLPSGQFATETDKRAWIEALQRHLTERWSGFGIVPTEVRLVQSRIADLPK